jgi:nucleoside-diphosphate-sugar epimerase
MASKGLVLITGVNGYIAARTVEAFLKAGYSVRGTVRSKPSTKGLIDALSEYAGKLEIVEVPDITVAGAFDEAVKGASESLNRRLIVFHIRYSRKTQALTRLLISPPQSP